MKKYIDAEKLKHLIQHGSTSMTSAAETFERVAYWLDMLPAEDVAPIKRCGKCSHCDVIFVINGETKKRTPHYFCENDYSKEVNSDDFCHIVDKALSTIAERKENADV